MHEHQGDRNDTPVLRARIRRLSFFVSSFVGPIRATYIEQEVKL